MDMAATALKSFLKSNGNKCEKRLFNIVKSQCQQLSLKLSSSCSTLETKWPPEGMDVGIALEVLKKLKNDGYYSHLFNPDMPHGVPIQYGCDSETDKDKTKDKSENKKAGEHEK